MSFLFLFKCFLLGWGGGKTVFKRLLLKRLVWLPRSSCVVSIIISLDLYILLFRKSSLAAFFCSPFYDFFFAFTNQELFVKLKDFSLWFLMYNLQIFTLELALLLKIYKRLTLPPSLKYFIVRRRVFKSFSHWLIWRWNIFVV